MEMRFSYQKDTLRPGQGVQFYCPKGQLLEEFNALDKPAVRDTLTT
jgi:hypothetical protein